MGKYRKKHKNKFGLFAGKTHFEKENIVCLCDVDKIVLLFDMSSD